MGLPDRFISCAKLATQHSLAELAHLRDPELPLTMRREVRQLSEQGLRPRRSSLPDTLLGCATCDFYRDLGRTLPANILLSLRRSLLLLPTSLRLACGTTASLGHE